MSNLLTYVHRENIKGIDRPPFKNIPLLNLPGKLDKLDKDKEIVVICQSGMRSVKATKNEKARLWKKFTM